MEGSVGVGALPAASEVGLHGEGAADMDAVRILRMARVLANISNIRYAVIMIPQRESKIEFP